MAETWTWTNPNIGWWGRWLLAFFANYRWCRRLLGGHWEYWWVEPCQNAMWLDTDKCSVVAGTRPPACFGTPICEDYPNKSTAFVTRVPSVEKP